MRDHSYSKLCYKPSNQTSKLQTQLDFSSSSLTARVVVLVPKNTSSRKHTTAKTDPAGDKYPHSGPPSPSTPPGDTTLSGTHLAVDKERLPLILESPNSSLPFTVRRPPPDNFKKKTPADTHGTKSEYTNTYQEQQPKGNKQQQLLHKD